MTWRTPRVPSTPTAHSERRRWVRVEPAAPARLSLNGTAWEGLAQNLSLGGTFMTFARNVSATENQPIQLGLQTDAGLLELKGTIRSLREIGYECSAPANAVQGLAVEFESLDTIREQIFMSILDALRERSVSVRLVGLLTPQDTGDLLLEIGAAGAEPVEAAEAPPDPSTAEEDAPDASAIISTQVECRNTAGQRIAIYHDAPRHAGPRTPLVIIAPGYGETKKEYVTMSYFLAGNGFQVLRYDHTNHVGESEGDILDATLTGMEHDLGAVLDFAERTWGAERIVVVATSLAGRVAFKRAACDGRVGLLCLLTGVVDVQATLLAVHQEDLILAFLRGVRRGPLNVLGFNVDADRFLGDAIKAGYATLNSTIQDALRIRTPTIFFAAEHDAWVNLESLKQVTAALGEHAANLFLIPEALHRLHENPRKARVVFRQLVTCCLKRLAPQMPARGILEPSRRQIGLQNRIERDRARAQHLMTKTEIVEFWQDYLDHFHHIANVGDYWHLLDHIYRLTGNLDGSMRVLDAGCGNGNFGMFLSINQAYRQERNTAPDATPVHYIGMDFIQPALAQARQNLRKTSAEVCGKLSRSAEAMALPLNFSLLAADLNMPLPFRDGHFDRVICNLVISYLQDPLSTLGEFMRVLSPNGRLVITNLKPHADLSQIYRNFVQRADRPEEMEEGRQLLNNSGKIKQAEGDGIFRFFDRQELAMLLTSSGAVQPRVYSTFANQGYIAVAEKPGPLHAPRRPSQPSDRSHMGPMIQA